MSVYHVCTDLGACNYYNIPAPDPWIGDGFYPDDGSFNYLPNGEGYYFGGYCTYGCDDPNGLNYHDGSCDPCGYPDCAGNFYLPGYTLCNSSSQDYFGICCGGCNDSNACGSTGNGCDYGTGNATCGCNTIDEGCGCGLGYPGCTDSSACNWDPYANCTDGGTSCNYGSGSASCGCNNPDLGCGCGNGWNGSLPTPSQVLSGVTFYEGQLSFTGTLQPGVPKSKVILSAALGIPIL